MAMCEHRRRSILFHLLVPGGKWQTVIDSPVRVACYRFRVLLKDRLDRFPAEIEVGTPGQSARWRKDAHLFAGRGAPPEALSAAPAGEIPGEGLALSRAAPGAAAAEADLGRIAAVYRTAEGGPVGVPTGEVLVRFASGVAAEERREALAGAGYELSQVLAYAPHAAWVRARSGDGADSLTGLGRLRALPDVEHVEPQLLSARAWKSEDEASPAPSPPERGPG